MNKDSLLHIKNRNHLVTLSIESEIIYRSIFDGENHIKMFNEFINSKILEEYNKEDYAEEKCRDILESEMRESEKHLKKIKSKLEKLLHK